MHHWWSLSVHQRSMGRCSRPGIDILVSYILVLQTGTELVFAFYYRWWSPVLMVRYSWGRVNGSAREITIPLYRSQMWRELFLWNFCSLGPFLFSLTYATREVGWLLSLELCRGKSLACLSVSQQGPVSSVQRSLLLTQYWSRWGWCLCMMPGAPYKFIQNGTLSMHVGPWYDGSTWPAALCPQKSDSQYFNSKSF